MEESIANATVTLALAPEHWLLAHFDPSVEGVEPITREGTPVPQSLEKEVRRAASDHGVSIRKVKGA